MNSVRITSLAFVAALAFGSLVASVPTAVADDATGAPCATQQTQVDRATTKLADLTATFAAHPNHKNLTAKKAQAQRLAHATTRLDSCVAAQTS